MSLASRRRESGGVAQVRSFAAAIGEAPTYYPAVPPTAEQLARHAALAAEAPPPISGRLGRYAKANAPAAALKRTLAAIEAADAEMPPLAPFLQVDAEGAAAAAAAAAEGTPGASPLYGVPVARDPSGTRDAFRGSRGFGPERRVRRPSKTRRTSRASRRASGRRFLKTWRPKTRCPSRGSGRRAR